CQTGSRFSLKAFAPSLASSEANTGPEIAPCLSHIATLDQSNCSCRMRLEAASASGPLRAMRPASSSAASSAAPGSARRLTTPKWWKRSAGEPGRLALDEGAEVHPGAEETAGAGQHPDRQLVVAVELLERAGDAGRERGVHRVAHLGTVERDHQHVLAALGEDWLGHDCG